jgi:hypothetical protein
MCRLPWSATFRIPSGDTVRAEIDVNWAFDDNIVSLEEAEL